MVFATGFIVLVLLSLPLFWIRFICEASLAEAMSPEARNVSIRPSGLVPDEFEKDPNVVSQSLVYAYSRPNNPLSLGIFKYFVARLPGGSRSNFYFFDSDRDWMYFDPESGQIVHCYTDIQVMPDKTTRAKDVQVYIGPEGISETAGKTLGRFIEPIIDRGWIDRIQRKSRELMLYDKKLRCFFKIDFVNGTIIKGPGLSKTDSHQPIRIGRLSKTFLSQNLSWTPPQIKQSENSYNLKSIIMTDVSFDAGSYLPVLDKSGRIDLLDKETLEFARATPELPRTAGRLPGPETYFGSKILETPRELLNYSVWPLALTKYFFENPEKVIVAFGDPYYNFKRSPARVERRYLGMFAASLSRDGNALALAVFDGKGRQIKTEYSRLPKQAGRQTSYLQSGKAVFFEAPWASTLTAGKYLAENLHPPILSIASYFTASAFEAASGHRALFLLPNSFVAMQGREHRGNFAERFFSAMWLILPSIILAIWLSIRVGKDAAVVGISENTRLYWIIGTLTFGLAAFITYRLTRPKITLVTCQNCGRPRRPDMAKCHRCKSAWLVPELIPPAWRVLDGAENVDESSKVDAAETAGE